MHNFWWVNQGKTYAQEKADGIIWAPQENRQGNAPFHWQNVSKVRKGDIIFHYCQGFVLAVSQAQENATDAPKPPSLGNREWAKTGWLVHVDYHEIMPKIPLGKIGQQIKDLGTEHGPINRQTAVNQGYLFAISRKAAGVISGEISANNIPGFLQAKIHLIGLGAKDSFAANMSHSAITSLLNSIKNQGYKFTFSQTAHFVCSTETKPFTILTGNSGTGKTKLAQLFAQWLDGNTSGNVTSNAGKDLSAYSDRRWFKLSFNDPDIKPAFTGDGNAVGTIRHIILGTGYMSLGWLEDSDPSREPKQKELMRNLKTGDIILAYGGDAYSLAGIGEIIEGPFVNESGEAFQAFRGAGKHFIRVQWLFKGPEKIKDFELPGNKSPAFAGWRNTINELNQEQIDAFVDYCNKKFFGKRHGKNPFPKKGCLHNTGNRYALVPVGADWTDNRNVLGFVNHLKKDEDSEKPTFQSTPILDMVLKANSDSAHPYFIILDEMNLSHVERYFSDFLSAMESGEPVPVHSEDGELPTSSGQTVPPKVVIPPNLFVIGTVNVDETTYMFSPKVLDRANVLEFRVEKTDLQKYLHKHVQGNTIPKTSTIDPAPTGTAEAFLELSKSARGLAGKPPLENPPDLENIQATLFEFFQILQKAGFEFAYRTANEVMRYARVSYALKPGEEDWDWQEVMDAQILQKLLPKLHGSRRRIEPTLVALAKLCNGERVEEALKAFDKNSVAVSGFDEAPGGYEGKKFPMSWRKLAEMVETSRRDQFVSFIQ